MVTESLARAKKSALKGGMILIYRIILLQQNAKINALN